MLKLRRASCFAPGDQPTLRSAVRREAGWWARQDSNLQPSGYEPPALTIELRARPALSRAFSAQVKSDTRAARMPDRQANNISQSADRAYVSDGRRYGSGYRDWLAAIGTKTMARISRLDHDEHGLAGRGASALLIGIVVVAFVALAAGATVYDIGKWLAIW